MSAAGPPVLLAHSCFLAHDAKQVRKMRPYAPLATLLAASVVRRSGREVALFDDVPEQLVRDVLEGR